MDSLALQAELAASQKGLAFSHLVQWTAAEDETLRAGVAAHGLKRWAYLATLLPGKGPKQCRRRWHNCLSATDAKQGTWTAAEDAVLLEAHAVHGNQWTRIAKLVGGRTDNAVKNRHMALVKKNKGRRKRPSAAEAEEEAEEEEEAEVSPRQVPISAAALAPPPALPPVRIARSARAAPSAAASPLARSARPKRARASQEAPAPAQARASMPDLQDWRGPDGLCGQSPANQQLYREVLELLGPAEGALPGITPLSAGAGELGGSQVADVLSWFLAGSPTAPAAAPAPPPADPTAPTPAQVAQLVRSLAPVTAPSEPGSARAAAAEHTLLQQLMNIKSNPAPASAPAATPFPRGAAPALSPCDTRAAGVAAARELAASLAGPGPVGSPVFSAGELQLLLATLAGGDNPFADWAREGAAEEELLEAVARRPPRSRGRGSASA